MLLLLYVRRIVVSVPAHSVASSVKVPWMLLVPIAEVIVNTVDASATLGLPETVHVVASSVKPAGSDGLTEHAVNSFSSGAIVTSP